MKIFDNVTWPNAMIYNVEAKSERKLGGGAEVEHIGTQETWQEEKKYKFAPTCEVEVIKAN